MNAAAKRSLTAAALLLVGLTLGVVVGLLLPDLAVKLGLPRALVPSPAPVEITLSAFVDGSDRFVFAGESLWNEHLAWQAPRKVQFNGQPWSDLTVAPPGWAEQARDLDLTRATIINRQGRDVIALEPTADGFTIYFADSQMGGAEYSVTVAIPRRGGRK